MTFIPATALLAWLCAPAAPAGAPPASGPPAGIFVLHRMLALLEPTPSLSAGGNQPPVCDAGPSVLQVPCNGPITRVRLDGSGSFDPDGDPLQFLWAASCEGAFFDDPTSPTPILSILSNGACNLSCTVFLRVSDGEFISHCLVRVFVYDAIPPVIDCAPLVKADCGETGPEVIGFPTVADACDPEPTLSYRDQVIGVSDCEADRYMLTIERTWTAVDQCGNVSTCIQTVLVLRRLGELDANPGSCPNGVLVDTCPGEVICPVEGPGKPRSLTMLYTGESCAATNHSQSAGNAGCTGDALGTDPVRILATNKINGGNIHVWFDGIVSLGEVFEVDASNAGMSWLQANTHLRIYDLAGELLQHAFFHTSCSQPLEIGDQFGSCQIVGFELTSGQAGGVGGGVADTVALTLVGSVDFDVLEVDLASLAIRDLSCQAAPILPHSTLFVDETNPGGQPACECVARAPDGILDLRIEVERQALVAALGLANVPPGGSVIVAVTGLDVDGCPFVAYACLEPASCP